jgi:hypothetical protein
VCPQDIFCDLNIYPGRGTGIAQDHPISLGPGGAIKEPLGVRNGIAIELVRLKLEAASAVVCPKNDGQTALF